MNLEQTFSQTLVWPFPEKLSEQLPTGQLFGNQTLLAANRSLLLARNQNLKIKNEYFVHISKIQKIT